MRLKEKGQAVVLFAVVMFLATLFLLGILDYAVTTARMQETIAAADLAAHAGAQEISVRPNGEIVATQGGAAVAAAYFNFQRPAYAQLLDVACGRFQGRPACQVTAQMYAPGYLLPERWITIHAIGYLAHGVTRSDQ